MKFTLKIWRQSGPEKSGHFETYEAHDIQAEMSFLEMLDVLNEQITISGGQPVNFDSDCREGICGMCSLVVNGIPHGGQKGTTVCQLHMRSFADGQTITIEPWRAKAFPVLKDLVVDRSAFDRIIQSGGYISVNTGGAPDANALPISKDQAEMAFDAAACIGCGACVAACKNSSAMLFAGAKVTHLNTLPQGHPEKYSRAVSIVVSMDKEGFGACTVTGACAAVCPKEIPLDVISKLNRDYAVGILKGVSA
ncbi:MAG: succinate dehydrogenase/fumarate reductase iron-sulfur subunit [Verrucomicrobia bacterium]|nr:succinate dehydrogenase/fumarate reductase iron-sulfur subunit [Verrucomicrobiota bacterium]